MRKQHFFLIFAALNFILSACGGEHSSNLLELEGKTWTLTSYIGNTPIDGRQPTIRFEAEQVSGTTGCNHYGGSYQISDDTLLFEGIYSTEMACLDPEGLMDQERIFLEWVGIANHYTLVDNVLTLFADQKPVLIFEIQQDELRTPTPALEQSTPTIDKIVSTSVPVFAPPAGFNPYQDSITGITVYIPDTWIVTGIQEGTSAILQSYPEDKYIGGEPRAPGDTKCDLNIRPVGATTDELIHQWRSNEMTTIISEEEIELQSGSNGQRFVIESMGRATVFITEIDQRVVLLTCFGDFTLVDEIATTLKVLE